MFPMPRIVIVNGSKIYDMDGILLHAGRGLIRHLRRAGYVPSDEYNESGTVFFIPVSGLYRFLLPLGITIWPWSCARSPMNQCVEMDEDENEPVCMFCSDPRERK